MPSKNGRAGRVVKGHFAKYKISNRKPEKIEFLLAKLGKRQDITEFMCL